LSGGSFDFQGQSRTYELYVPSSYDGRRHVPLVFDFHGYGSSAAEQMLYGNFRPEAERDGFVIVAPDGQGDADRHFNFDDEPGKQDDVAMVRALLARLEGDLCIDATRVYATGMSDGGAMSSVLACVAADTFAAFAPVAVVLAPAAVATYRPPCRGPRPVAIEAFAGTADPVVPFNGGTVQCCGNPRIGAAPDAMGGWAARDGCGAPTDVRLGSEVRRRTWQHCADQVVFYIVDGGGHTWPGAVPVPRLGLTTRQVDASSTIWAFFAAHHLG
jgi:polyhydroxybutyrate depolymerase